MSTQLWTVVRFPVGQWSTGGSPKSPDYESCEVYLIDAVSRQDAIRKAQRVRAKLKRQGKDLPTQEAPYRAEG